MPSSRSLVPVVERALQELGGRAHRTEIRDRAKQLGAFSPEQLAEPTRSLGKRRQYASEIDYRLSWALHHCHKDGTIEKLGRGYWRLSQEA